MLLYIVVFQWKILFDNVTILLSFSGRFCLIMLLYIVVFQWKILFDNVTIYCCLSVEDSV